VPDRFDEDDFWNEPREPAEPPRETPRPRTGAEGVRIIGSEEAEDAVESGRAAPRLGDDDLHFGDVPPRPEAPVEPTATFPLSDDRDLTWGFDDPPSWSASSEGTDAPGLGARATDFDPALDEPVPLPSWDQPAPVVGADAGDPEDAWASISGRTPRYDPEPPEWPDEPQPAPEFREDIVAEPDPDVVAPADVVPGFYGDDDTGEVPRRRGRGAGRRAARPVTQERRPEPGGLEGEPLPDDGQSGPPVDLMTRVLTAAAVAVVALVMFKLGDGTAAILVAVIVGFAAFELFEAFRRMGYHPATPIGLLGAGAGVLIAYEKGLHAFPLVIALVVIFTMVWYMAEVMPRARPVVNIALTLFGFLWIGGFGMFGGLLLSVPNGTGLVMGLAICAVGYDVVGYFVGSQFGRSKLAPRVSPNKTWEGLFGGMAASVVLGVVVSSVLSIHPWDGKVGHGLALGLVVAVMAPFGDLCESMIKRDLGVKDLGTILPGHGGVLDRFDGILFCLPAVYYLAVQLNIG
jgi:phosphatidate cytidylyltransferase